MYVVKENVRIAQLTWDCTNLFLRTSKVPELIQLPDSFVCSYLYFIMICKMLHLIVALSLLDGLWLTNIRLDIVDKQAINQANFQSCTADSIIMVGLSPIKG